MLIETIFLFLLYIAYASATYYFLSKLFGTAMIKMRDLIVILLINSALVYVPVYITHFYNGEILWLVFFIVIGIEILLLYKQDFLLSVTMALGFTLNFFATRTLFTGILALNVNQQVVDMLKSQENRVMIMICTFLVLFPYNLISSKFLNSKIIKHIASNRISLKLACALLASVCVIQLVSIPTMFVETESVRFNPIYQIRTGIFAHISFIVIMLIVYIYGRLKEATDTYVDTTAEIKTENLTISKLEAEAKTDFFTGFYVKSIVVKKLAKFLEKKETCYVIYLDLDGLKIVNDTFGHEEGDWYIKTAAKCIKESFPYDTIARIGGDEFLIVGNESKGYSAMERADSCYNRVMSLKGRNKKPYETSISYGVVEVDESNNLSIDGLIDLADSKMYDFKKSRQKERKA